MLVKFEVENFLSFKDKQTLDLTARKSRTKNNRVYEFKRNKILKFAAIFGANAAGKSNLVTAIDYMKNRVIESKGKVSKSYFKNESHFKDKPTLFNSVICIDDVLYSYGFSLILNENKYTQEWLNIINHKGEEKRIFYRDIDNGFIEISSYFNKKETANKLKMYGDDIKSDNSILFLQLMNTNKNEFYNDENDNAKILKKVYSWFLTNLNVNFPRNEISGYSYFFSDENNDKICEMLKKFSMGITNFQITSIDSEQLRNKIPKDIINDINDKLHEEILKDNDSLSTRVLLKSAFSHDFFVFEMNAEGQLLCKTIKFAHENTNALFELSEESDGTVRVLDLLEILLDNSRSVYVIDELNRYLHPLLTYKLVEEFLELAKEKNVQLITTTHEQRLLSFDLLRKDEIWFMKKHKFGYSELYNLCYLNPRSDKRIDKAYLDGDFGAIPLFP